MVASPVVQQIMIETARKYGIDPEAFLTTARGEGFQPDTWQSRSKNEQGILEPSYGPFQFLVGGPGTGYGPGVGNDFMKDTGLDPRDPKNLPQMIDYAGKQIATHGWDKWMGAGKVGLTGLEGVGGRPAEYTRNRDPLPDFDYGAPGAQPAASRVEHSIEARDERPIPDMTTSSHEARDEKPVVGAQNAFPPAPTPPDKKKGWQEAIAEGLGNVATAMAPQQRQRSNLTPLQTVMTPGQVMPMFNPQDSEIQRQELAQRMARLNSGQLWG